MPKITNKKEAKKTSEVKPAASSSPSTHQRKARIVSLFSGAGGLEIAACKTGWVEAVVSTDSNATFLSTVEKNLPAHFPELRHSSVVADARALKGSVLKKLLGSTPDLVMGGPPCDDYTKFGKRRGFEGEKGPLIFEFLRLVDELRPDCFVFENVPNLIQQFKGVFERFLAKSQDLGFHTKWALLKACNYGAPTTRVRVFVVGWRDSSLNQAFRYPDATHCDASECALLIEPRGSLKPFRFVSDVLEGLPDVSTSAAQDVFNHIGRVHRPATIEQLKAITPGKRTHKSFRFRAPWNGLSPSITAGTDRSTKSYIHPRYHREMSVREYARLHMFPDSWFFQGTNDNGVKQVANSIPLPLGEAVLTAALDCLLKGKAWQSSSLTVA